MSEEKRPRPLRLLFVDDDPLICSCFSSLVTAMCKAAVSVCHNAEEALQLLTEHTYDLVITDLVMPGPLDGLQLAERVIDTYHIPVILISGYAMEDVLPLGLPPTKAICCLSKPYTVSQVKEKITLALAGTENPAEQENNLVP